MRQRETSKTHHRDAVVDNGPPHHVMVRGSLTAEEKKTVGPIPTKHRVESLK